MGYLRRASYLSFISVTEHHIYSGKQKVRQMMKMELYPDIHCIINNC